MRKTQTTTQEKLENAEKVSSELKTSDARILARRITDRVKHITHQSGEANHEFHDLVEYAFRDRLIELFTICDTPQEVQELYESFNSKILKLRAEVNIYNGIPTGENLVTITIFAASEDEHFPQYKHFGGITVYGKDLRSWKADQELQSHTDES